MCEVVFLLKEVTLRNKIYGSSLLIYLIMAIAGAFIWGPHIGAQDHVNPAGFLLGFANGISAMVLLVVSLFNSDYTIYNSNNTGFFYNWGFIMGVTFLPALKELKNI